MTVLSDDIEKLKSTQSINLRDELIRASQASGRNPLGMVLDAMKLRSGRGKLKYYEYFLYELYDNDRWNDDERRRFLSAHIHWPIVNKCNDKDWWAVTEDKWLSSIFLAHHDFPIPENIAVFDRGQRSYGNLPKLSNADELKNFLVGLSPYPIFAKTISGMWSAGAFRISGCSDTHVEIDGRDPVSFEQLFNDLLGDVAYLFQRCIKPHKFFDGITGAIATVRSLNIIDEGGLSVPCTLLKLPVGDSIADNFWRGDNLLCHLNGENGEIVSIVANENGRRVELASLPGSQRTLNGERLPDWAELVQLNERVALAHTANRFGSTDIALTENGPVVVEVNNGCAFELVQMATGKGFLTDQMLAFFEKNGAIE